LLAPQLLQYLRWPTLHRVRHVPELIIERKVLTDFP
jgi:hypothetical protein